MCLDAGYPKASLKTLPNPVLLQSEEEEIPLFQTRLLDWRGMTCSEDKRIPSRPTVTSIVHRSKIGNSTSATGCLGRTYARCALILEKRRSQRPGCLDAECQFASAAKTFSCNESDAMWNGKKQRRKTQIMPGATHQQSVAYLPHLVTNAAAERWITREAVALLIFVESNFPAR